MSGFKIIGISRVRKAGRDQSVKGRATVGTPPMPVYPSVQVTVSDHRALSKLTSPSPCPVTLPITGPSPASSYAPSSQAGAPLTMPYMCKRTHQGPWSEPGLSRLISSFENPRFSCSHKTWTALLISSRRPSQRITNFLLLEYS